MPKDPNNFTHRGADLIIALYRYSKNPAPRSVKVLKLKTQNFVHLLAEEALLLAKERIYEGVVWQGRVFKMREVDNALTPNPAYWDDRACIKYHDDGSTMIPKKIKDAMRAAHWDNMFKAGKYAKKSALVS